MVKRRKQHKGEGQGGWVDIEHCDEDTCITNSKYTTKISTQNYRKVAMPRKSHWPCDLCKRAAESQPAE